MSKSLSTGDRLALLNWADRFRPTGLVSVSTPISKCFKTVAEQDLRNYWGLARTARNLKVEESIRTKAHSQLFLIRTKMEKWFVDSALEALRSRVISAADLLDGTVFGSSLKQGVSFRLPLSSCQPTAHCAGGCYAHDGLDASITTVIRGSLNGAFAQHYDDSAAVERSDLLKIFSIPLKKAVHDSLRDSERSGFKREARIRMSHVGELTAYPAFANAIAGIIHELTGGKVKCIIYTRHKGAKLLDPKLFVINFTLDDASLNRRSWAPDSARIVYSAWEGKIRDDVGVNFLEHHHLAHTTSTGSGKICPATRPETNDRTCDGVKCDYCFRPPTRGEQLVALSVRSSSETTPESSIALGTATSTKLQKSTFLSTTLKNPRSPKEQDQSAPSPRITK